MKVLALEPYFGGSHRQFLEDWAACSRHDFEVLGLPPFKWKWRMRHSAISFAEDIARRVADGQRWDVLWCSDMLSLADLLGLTRDALAGLPAIVYFHENQITYPVRMGKERDYHFGLTNFTTALAASEVWFNSAFHRDAFLGSLPSFLRKMPDRKPLRLIDSVVAKSRVMHPGVEDPLDPLNSLAPPSSSPNSCSPGNKTAEPETLHILWAARWEFDKDPETFFRALERLGPRTDFRLSVLGESFSEVPEVFSRAHQRWSDRIRRWGFLERRTDYLEALLDTDVFVSTAQHEFFGLGAVEAALAGAYPLLPDRLAYPELVDRDERFLYQGGAGVLAKRLRALSRAKNAGELERESARPLVERFLWRHRQPELDAALEEVVEQAVAG